MERTPSMFIGSLRRERTLKERITDWFLLLYLLNDAKIGLGDTKVHKLVYLSELDMKLQGYKGFNFNFIKLPFGPFSSDLKKDTSDMVDSWLITDYAHKTTSFGKTILKNFDHLLKDNSVFAEKIHEINGTFAGVPRDELVTLVHNMKNPEKPWLTIDETRRGSYILRRMKLCHKDRAFKISESDIASLEIYFNPRMFAALKMSLQEAKSESAIKLSEVADVV